MSESSHRGTLTSQAQPGVKACTDTEYGHELHCTVPLLNYSEREGVALSINHYETRNHHQTAWHANEHDIRNRAAMQRAGATLQ
jgi:hypothetical protein